jgi:hypothetical protein
VTHWGHIANRLKAVPAGVWAALGVALALFTMYLRGRRVEAELSATKLKLDAAEAASRSARSEGRAAVHEARADKHNERVAELEVAAVQVQSIGRDEQRRLAALPANKVTAEYLKLAAADKVTR